MYKLDHLFKITGAVLPIFMFIGCTSLNSLKDLPAIADSLPTNGKLNCQFNPTPRGASGSSLSSEFVPAPLDRVAIQSTTPPTIYNDPLTQGFLTALDSQVAVRGPSAFPRNASANGIYAMELPEMSEGIQGRDNMLELNSNDFKKFTKIFANTVLDPATYTEVNNPVASGRAAGIAKNKNLSLTFKKYYQAYLSGNYIDRTGTKFKKPEIKKSIGNDTISAALSIFLDALGDTYVSTPIVKKKVSQKKVITKTHMDMFSLQSAAGKFIIGFSTWEREGFKVGDRIKISDLSGAGGVNNQTYEIEKLTDNEAKVDPSPADLGPDSTFRIEVEREDISYAYYPHEKNEQPTAGKEKFVTEVEISDKSNECGITEPEAKAIGFLSGLAAEQSSLLSGFVLESFGDIELAFVVGGHFSVGDNETLATIVKTFFEVSSRRAVERGAYEFFYAYSYNGNSPRAGSTTLTPPYTFFDPAGIPRSASTNSRYQAIATFLGDFN